MSGSKSEAALVALPYPHARNDCDGCRERDAEMRARYDGLQGRDLRWCQRCAGSALEGLVLLGITVTVTPREEEQPAMSDDAVDREEVHIFDANRRAALTALLRASDCIDEMRTHTLTHVQRWRQVGWLGFSGQVYGPRDEARYTEPAGLSPLWLLIDNDPATSQARAALVAHPFDADPEASLPGVYCKCGFDVDVHPDKGNSVIRNGRYVLPDPTQSKDQPNEG